MRRVVTETDPKFLPNCSRRPTTMDFEAAALLAFAPTAIAPET